MMKVDDRKKKRAALQKKILTQAGFIELLGMRFKQDLDKGMREEPMFSWFPVANRTRMIADARRIRRELAELIKMLEENAW